jgi:hypothetical protein
MGGTLLIDAESLEQAKEIALNDSPLPQDGAYLEDSFQIDEELLEEYNNENMV